MTTTFKTWTIIVLSTIHANAGREAPSGEQASVSPVLSLADPIAAATLTITKVRKPWYAWRSLVLGKMKKTIPQYQAVKGLQQKFYSFTENRKFFGGIYWWQTTQDAKNWFNQAWFDQTEKKYGEKGEVRYFQIAAVKTTAPLTGSQEMYWAVLSYPDQGLFSIDTIPEGLLRIVSLTDADQQPCLLTVWQNKKLAAAYFGKQKTKNEFFDTPILLNHAK